MSNGLVRIQFRVDQDGQAPSFRLSEFSVNKVTTAIGNDANGSITNLPGGMGVPPMILAYDSEGNLACVSNTVSGAVSLYWYDQHGRRIAKSEAGLLTLYIWDGMDIIATAHADGTIREYFTRGIGIAGDVGSLIAETRFSGGTATTTYLHSNWRGDVVMATDASGAVVGEYAYTTFGEQLSVTGTYTPRFTFSSKERDTSGLIYHGFRYYSPVLCRWISEDPIREFGGINLYQFVGNNPVNFIDPHGRNPFLVAGLLAFDIGIWAQVSVEVQGRFFMDRGAIAAEIQSNASTMDMLRQVIASEGEMEWPDNYGQAGQMGTDLPPQGGVCEERQKVRNLFESSRNVRGYRSAGGELVARLATGAFFEPLPKDMLPGYRLELAKALLNRQQAYHNFLNRIY
jgi:RHS repeat-associated protein